MSSSHSPSAAVRPAEERPAPDFETLLEKIGRQQDREAFITLFEYFAPRVKSFLLKGGLNEDTADELAQETLLAVWQKSSQFDRRRARASTWIYTIARNKKIDFLRRKSPDITDPADLMIADDGHTHPIEEISRIRDSENIHTALKDLSDEQRFVINKAFFEGQTHAEIAQKTGIPLGTVKSRIRQALEKLRGAGTLRHIDREDLP